MTRKQALDQLAIWADVEHEAHEQRLDLMIAARVSGATIYEIAAATKKTPQGISKWMRRYEITVDNHARGE